MTQSDLYQRGMGWHPRALTPDYKTSVAQLPKLARLALQNLDSELTGPIFDHIDIDLIRNNAKSGDPIGERIIVYGRVLDENGRPVPNTLVEI